MPTSFMCGLYLRGKLEHKETARRLANCLGVLRSHGLEPRTLTEDAWRARSVRVFGGISLGHPEWVASTGDPFWGAGFGSATAGFAATLVIMTVPAGHEASRSWRWLLPLAEELAEAIAADAALINGYIPDDTRPRGGVPFSRLVAPGHPAEVLCPWMYWSPGRLAEDGLAADRLAELPAARSSATRGGGWVLQVHDDYSATTPKKLQKAWSSAWGVSQPKWLGVR